MRSGGSKTKGSAWERAVGQTLSLWISSGQRGDLFSRAVLSGGRFTLAAMKQGPLGQPGDLIAADPLAFPFLACFTVEAKHYRDLGVGQFLAQQRGSFLESVIHHSQQQASQMSKRAMVVTKQNRLPALVWLDRTAGEAMLRATVPSQRKQPPLPHHWLWNGQHFCCLLDDMIRTTEPNVLLRDLAQPEALDD